MSLSSGLGRCYDSNNNDLDFYAIKPMSYPPHNTSTIESYITGTPAVGALIFVNDELSSAVSAIPSGSPPSARCPGNRWRTC